MNVIRRIINDLRIGDTVIITGFKDEAKQNMYELDDIYIGTKFHIVEMVKCPIDSCRNFICTYPYCYAAINKEHKKRYRYAYSCSCSFRRVEI